MAVTYVRNQETGEFEVVGSGGASTDITLSQVGKPADAAAVGGALAGYATKTELSGKSDIGHYHNTFNSLIDMGITAFPTTMKTIADTMPNGSILIIDSRRINGVEASLSTQTISDWGNTDNGVALIMKGSSEHRICMQINHSVTDATGAYMDYGNYAYSTNNVNWESTKDKVDKSTLANIFSTYYDLTTNVTPGENYSAASGSASLIGNMLRVRFSATRTSAANGNIDNETVATFSVEHCGKITGGFAVSLGNGTSGHLANMLVSSVACDETALTFKVTLTATGGDTTAVNPYFAIPVVIDVTKF